jgi:antitoxin (DNA-binding transcriptional repressor) of toxin-antitoxin stability system
MTKAVGVRELKTHLSHYLRDVKAGITVTITEHGRPVAEIRATPAPVDSDEEALQRMAAKGLVTLPKPGAKLRPHTPIRLPDGVSASALIIEEREDRI